MSQLNKAWHWLLAAVEALVADDMPAVVLERPPDQYELPLDKPPDDELIKLLQYP